MFQPVGLNAEGGWIWYFSSWNKASPPPLWMYHVFKVCSNLYRRRLQGLIRPSKAGLVVSILVQCPAQSIIQATLLAYPYLHIYSSEKSWKPVKVYRCKTESHRFWQLAMKTKTFGFLFHDWQHFRQKTIWNIIYLPIWEMQHS